MAVFRPILRPFVGGRQPYEPRRAPGPNGVALTGTITTNSLKNNTGTLLASESGITVYVYAVTGALVLTVTGETTDLSGVMTFSDALIVTGTPYRCVIVLASGAEGMDTITAT